jgi:predicted TIM-barrel fold metal-dependent hydrolase
VAHRGRAAARVPELAGTVAPPFVDTHVHLWDLRRTDVRWQWLEWDYDEPHPLVGDYEAIKAPRYDSAALRAESRGAGTVKVVHVQAAVGTADPVAETRWLEELARASGWPDGIVAHADLKSPQVERELERHAEASDRLRGIRDFSSGDYLVDEAFRRGYAALERYRLVCDLDCQWQEMEKARDLARAVPGVTMVLDHAGYPQRRDDEYFRSWRTALARLAGAESAVVKISGLGMGDPAWTVDSIRPWVLACIESFGAERAFFGTNWPVDRLFSSYDHLVDAYRAIVGDFTAAEQEALLVRNAERVYRL